MPLPIIEVQQPYTSVQKFALVSTNQRLNQLTSWPETDQSPASPTSRPALRWPGGIVQDRIRKLDGQRSPHRELGSGQLSTCVVGGSQRARYLGREQVHSRLFRGCRYQFARLRFIFHWHPLLVPPVPLPPSPWSHGKVSDSNDHTGR